MPAELSPAHRQLLDQASAGQPLTAAWLTDTRVDAGHWWRRARLGVGLAGGELILAAPGPRPFVARAPLTALQPSLYNAVTGEVILAPAAGLPVRSLRLAPVEGHQLLAQIQQKETTHVGIHH